MANHIVTTTAHVGGTVAPNGLVSVADGANQAFVATPGASHVTHKWLLDSVQVAVDTNNYTLFAVVADHTVDVIFTNSTKVLEGDAYAVAPISNVLEGDAWAFPWETITLHGDAIAAWEFDLNLEGDAYAVMDIERLPNNVPNPQRVCSSKICCGQTSLFGLIPRRLD